MKGKMNLALKRNEPIGNTLTVAVVFLMLLFSMSACDSLLTDSEKTPEIPVESPVIVEPPVLVESPVLVEDDVKGAYLASVFGLGDAELYEDSGATVSRENFALVRDRFVSRFGLTGSLPATGAPMTRSEVITLLYGMIAPALSLAPSYPAVDYFVKNALLAEADSERFRADEPCVNHELLVLAKRAYEHIAYALKMDSRGYFWQVSDRDNTVYLLGSIHLSDSSAFPLSKNIMRSARRRSEYH